jgi:hypothetical protein
MYLIRHKKPEIALKLIPWFVVLDIRIENMYLELLERMNDDPDDTYVCVCYDDDNSVCGMTIAYCRDNDVFIWQANTRRDVPRSLVDEAFNAIIEWAKDKGFKLVTGKPNRVRRIWKRRWGFKPTPDNETEVYKEI